MDTDKDQRDTVRSLVSKIGDGLDNPMLAAIVEAASSPTAADKYVTKTLGWPNPVGQMVRDMVHLRQKVDKVDAVIWKSLTDSQLRPSNVLFEFGFGQDAGLNSNFGVEVAMRWGSCRLNRSSWPLLLREFNLPMKKDATTFDGTGDASQKGVNSLNPQRILFDMGFVTVYGEDLNEALKLQIIVNANQPSCFKIASRDDSALEQFSIYGRSVTLLPSGERIFPEFHKVIFIKKNHPDETVEEITVTVRRDLCGLGFDSGLDVGSVSYRKIICDLGGGGWKAVLNVNYLVWLSGHEFCLTFKTKEDSLISISCPEGNLASNVSCIWLDKAAEAARNLSSTLKNILYPPSLQKILGRELIENPPEALSDLLRS
ncbi:MAG: hypothetical protein Q8Q90_03185 [bacterium]|nr:hypothetical protein [bacterium]